MKDIKVQEIIEKERMRQEAHIELIASENFVSKDVLEATGSILTNKYAEGYPGKRYYDGCEFADEVENLAIDRVKELFGVKFANVQPHSGSQANFGVYTGLLNAGDKIMGLSLDAGGHLTHGYKVNASGKYFESVSYGVDENGLLDYEAIRELAIKEKPQMIICGYSAYPREFDFAKFREIADEVGALLMADIAHIAGLVAVGLHNSPVGHAHVITSTTHKTLRGARGGLIMTNDPEIAKKVDGGIFPRTQGGPLMHSIAGKAVAFGEALQPEFKEYIQAVVDNSKAFANKFIELGGSVVTGGTDNHLFTVDVKKSYGITGKEASSLLQEFGITVNKNTVPNDTESPFVTSGIRLGTAPMTTKGFNVDDFENLAVAMDKILRKDTEGVKRTCT